PACVIIFPYTTLFRSGQDQSDAPRGLTEGANVGDVRAPDERLHLHVLVVVVRQDPDLDEAVEEPLRRRLHVAGIGLAGALGVVDGPEREDRLGDLEAGVLLAGGPSGDLVQSARDAVEVVLVGWHAVRGEP